jgi:AAA+ ATPase superfamily predicted ATPase
MDSPFVYGSVLSGKNFLNRKDEIERLRFNIKSRNSSVLISPRRWGKSSLVKQVAHTFDNESKYVFCFIDVFPLKSEKEFLELYAKSVLRAFESKFDELIKTAKEFLSSITPAISFSIDPNAEVQLKLNLTDTKSAEDILLLSQKLAKKHKKTLVVCLDEFQNIEQFNDPLNFQKTLRSFWQNQNDVCFLIYGSKRHMMYQMFAKRSYPFYKFGDLITLEKINTEEWVPYLQKHFKARGKSISKKLAEKLVESVNRHTQYVQHLAHLAFYHTPDGKALTEENLDKSIANLIKDNQPLFQAEFEQLSKQQVSFLKMLMSGITSGFTKNENLKRFEIKSSSAVTKILQALEKKDIIDRYGSEISFTDPVFRLWLKRILD